MGIMEIGIVVVVGLILSALYAVFLAGKAEYPDADARDVDREGLFRRTEKLLLESERWPIELRSGSVSLASSLEPYPVRTVMYAVETDAPMEAAIEYVRGLNYSGPGRTDRPEKDKYEVILWEEDRDGLPYEWIRRSVHISPPPGANRDAVVLYLEDRSDPEAFRIAFCSVESMEGKEFPEVEKAVRFKVLESLYEVERQPGGRVRIRKIEAVDPRGPMSNWMNNHVISRLFFRSYMFDEAREMESSLRTALG